MVALAKMIKVVKDSWSVKELDDEEKFFFLTDKFMKVLIKHVWFRKGKTFTKEESKCLGYECKKIESSGK